MLQRHSKMHHSSFSIWKNIDTNRQPMNWHSTCSRIWTKKNCKLWNHRWIIFCSRCAVVCNSMGPRSSLTSHLIELMVNGTYGSIEIWYMFSILYCTIYLFESLFFFFFFWDTWVSRMNRTDDDLMILWCCAACSVCSGCTIQNCRQSEKCESKRKWKWKITQQQTTIEWKKC